MKPLRISWPAKSNGYELLTNRQHYPSDEPRKLQPTHKSKTPKMCYTSLIKSHCKNYLLLPPFQETFSRNSDPLKSPSPHWANPLCVSNVTLSLLIQSPDAREERHPTSNAMWVIYFSSYRSHNVVHFPLFRVCVFSVQSNPHLILKRCGIEYFYQHK